MISLHNLQNNAFTVCKSCKILHKMHKIFVPIFSCSSFSWDYAIGFYFFFRARGTSYSKKLLYFDIWCVWFLEDMQDLLTLIVWTILEKKFKPDLLRSHKIMCKICLITQFIFQMHLNHPDKIDVLKVSGQNCMDFLHATFFPMHITRVYFFMLNLLFLCMRFFSALPSALQCWIHC